MSVAIDGDMQLDAYCRIPGPIPPRPVALDESSLFIYAVTSPVVIKGDIKIDTF